MEFFLPKILLLKKKKFFARAYKHTYFIFHVFVLRLQYLYEYIRTHNTHNYKHIHAKIHALLAHSGSVLLLLVWLYYFLGKKNEVFWVFLLMKNIFNFFLPIQFTLKCDYKTNCNGNKKRDFCFSFKQRCIPMWSCA